MPPPADYLFFVDRPRYITERKAWLDSKYGQPVRYYGPNTLIEFMFIFVCFFGPFAFKTQLHIRYPLSVQFCLYLILLGTMNEIERFLPPISNSYVVAWHWQQSFEC